MNSNHTPPLPALCGVLLLGATAACGTTPSDPEPPAPGVVSEEQVAASPEEIVLSTVDGVELTLANALEAFLSSHMGHGSLVQGEPAVRELAGRIIERRLFLAEADALGIPDLPEIAAAVRQKQLDLAEALFWRLEVDEKVEVSEKEVEDFYSRTDMALTIHYLEVEDREAAETIRQQVVDGADIEDLAERNSIHPSRDFGGLMGYVRRGDLERDIEDEVFALEEKGALTPIVATKAGFAFARFEAKTTNPNRPDRKIAIPQIRSVLEERAKEARKAEVEEQLRQEVGVTVDDSLITRDRMLATTTPEAVVARVGDEEFTLGELRESLNLDAVRQAPDGPALQKALRELVDDWVHGWIVQFAVEGTGLTEAPEIVEKVERYREDIELGWLYSNYIYVDLQPSEEDARAFYEEKKDELFTQPEELLLAYIVVETEEEARAVLQRIENGEDFGAIAKEESIDPASAALGGRTNWVRPGMMLPAVEELAFSMETGSHAGPIETDLGWFVLHLLERKEPFLVPFEPSKRRATAELVKQRRSDAHYFWAQRLRERAEVEISEEGVRQAVAWLALEAEKQAEEEEAAKAAALAAEEEAARAMIGPMPDVKGGEQVTENSGGNR